MNPILLYLLLIMSFLFMSFWFDFAASYPKIRTVGHQLLFRLHLILIVLHLYLGWILPDYWELFTSGYFMGEHQYLFIRVYIDDIIVGIVFFTVSFLVQFYLYIFHFDNSKAYKKYCALMRFFYTFLLHMITIASPVNDFLFFFVVWFMVSLFYDLENFENKYAHSIYTLLLIYWYFRMG